MRRIVPSDAPEMQRLIRDSREHLKGYIEWAAHSANWDFRNINQFVMDHVNAELPREHFVFTIGKRIVGMGSLCPMQDSRTIQLALFVRKGFTGKGIAKRIVKSLENYAFEIIGYETIYYNHDITNTASGRIPRQMGYEYVDCFEAEALAESESGVWLSYKKDRFSNLPPGLIQGASLDRFTNMISDHPETY